MTTDQNCLFCRIVRKEISAEMIYEDEHAVAFLDIHPRVPGHTMVISKHHSPDLAGLPKEEIGPLFEAAQKVSVLIRDGLKVDGLTVGINEGKVSGQEVPHLHVHIMPRFEGDGGGSIQSVVHNPPHDSLSEVRMKIQK